MKKNQKIIIASAAILLLASLTLAYALVALQQTQIIHISGTAKYPYESPYPSATPTDTPPGLLQFSLWFPNGTAFPPSIVNPPLTVFTGNVVQNYSDQAAKISYVLTFVARNDGSVPLNVTLSYSAPPTLKPLYYIGFGFDPKTSSDATSAVVAVGQNRTLSVDFTMVISPVIVYANGDTFDYSFDLNVIGTQATLTAFLFLETEKLSKVVKPKKQIATFNLNSDHKASGFLLFLAEVFKAMQNRKNVYIELEGDTYNAWELYP